MLDHMDLLVEVFGARQVYLKVGNQIIKRPPRLIHDQWTRWPRVRLDQMGSDAWKAGPPPLVGPTIVRCSTCRHWSAGASGGGGIGTCATGADERSRSALDRRPLSAWPDAPRHCDGWQSQDAAA